MRSGIIGMLAALAMVAPAIPVSAGSKSPKLAKCDGKQRRVANPYGSILPTVDPQSGTSTPANQETGRTGVHVFPDPASTSSEPVRADGKPSTHVPPISSASPPTAYRSC